VASKHEPPEALRTVPALPMGLERQGSWPALSKQLARLGWRRCGQLSSLAGEHVVLSSLAWASHAVSPALTPLRRSVFTSFAETPHHTGP